MHREHHRWYSGRVGRDMDVLVYGHYGAPLLVFPTSGGDHREYEGQGMIDALGHLIDAGKVKVFCVDSMNNQSWYDKRAHPRHRSYVQAMYDDYIASEVAPFVTGHCQAPWIAITTSGSSFGAYHAVNSLFKHPDRFRRCIAMSGVYDVRRFMDGDYDDNFYFNNPIDYVANLDDPWYRQQLDQCDIHLVTGHGPYEDSGPTYRFSEVLRRKGIRHSVDDWGGEGGHDWPYWKRMIVEYVGRLF
ncbi:MAG TPA: alpha/beta hydrolase-fold protein [Vicinamibacteria bacterium]|nr:alpha/beta hydrolase-fold protein [Vicinamibacteria bacterium]